MEIRAEKNPWGNRIELLIMHRVGDQVIAVAEPLTMRDIAPNEAVIPTTTPTAKESTMNLTQQLVRSILQNPHGFEWSIQGLGMLRLYLSREVRLHVPNVSEIHDHPWGFTSEVVFGRLINYRYVIDHVHGVPMNCRTLKCGPGGCLVGGQQVHYLRHSHKDVLEVGDTYEQRRDEIHASEPDDGTVTIITRRFEGDSDHARVFWPIGTEWGSAEPRKATRAEVDAITKNALQKPKP